MRSWRLFFRVTGLHLSAFLLAVWDCQPCAPCQALLTYQLASLLVYCCCSVTKPCGSLWPHGLQLTRPPCPSPSPRAYSVSCPLSWWCHPSISSSIALFSPCLQSFPASGSFPKRWLFASGGQGIEISASVSVLPMNIQGWFPLGWTGYLYMYTCIYFTFILALLVSVLEKAMATHSTTLAWTIPGTVEPGGLLSMGSHKVGYDWSDLAAAAVNA